MKTDTADRIVEYITAHTEVTAHQLRQHVGIGAPALFRQLKKLIESGKIAKSGTPPRVFYYIPKADTVVSKTGIENSELQQLVDQNFFYITPIGEIKEGESGFVAWCQKQGLPVEKTAREYGQTLKKYHQFKREGFINGLPKLQGTFSEVNLDEMYYLDFYSIERFGKTKLGWLLLYAKQSQSLELMRRVFSLVVPKVELLIQKKNIMGVGFVPPTISRSLQFQKELEKHLALTIPKITIIKATGAIPVAQKTLNKLDDRVENAASTMFIDDMVKPDRVLLIDDAVGSGASMNEVARKIKNKNPKAVVIGLAIVGSFKGFEVLNEV